METVAIEVREISAADSIEEAGPLLVEHWTEIAKNKAVMVLKPDVGAYRELEANGQLLSLGAFDEDGRMVGYCVTALVTHLHYADLVVAENDVIFVTRSRRHEGLGQHLMRETERMAKERGAGLVLWHAKHGTALDAMLFEQGYAIQDVVYGRPL